MNKVATDFSSVYAHPRKWGLLLPGFHLVIYGVYYSGQCSGAGGMGVG